MRIKHRIQDMFWKLGIDVSRSRSLYHPLGRKKFLLERNNINVVLDVGANVGQSGHELRNYLGYKEKIISFEPLQEAYKILQEKSKKDPNWEIFNFALGDIEAKRSINISENLVSSSFLDMLPLHIKAAPASIYTGKQEIYIKKLDSIFSDLCQDNDRIYLKTDTQGFDSRVILGAKESLPRIDFVQIEMFLAPLYEDEVLVDEMIALMADNNFQIIALESGFLDPVSGRTLQVDGIFERVRE